MEIDDKKLLEFSYHENIYLSDYIKTADTKASMVITLNGVVIGFVINKLRNVLSVFFQNFWFNAMLVVGGIALIFSYWFTLRLIFPNLSNKSGNGIIFWEDISKIELKDYYSKVKYYANILDEMIKQNYYLAKTATRKYNLLKFSFIFSYIGYILILLYFIMFNGV